MDAMQQVTKLHKALSLSYNCMIDALLATGKKLCLCTVYNPRYASPPRKSAPTPNEEHVAQLIELLGVPRERAVRALSIAKGDLERAANLLMGPQELTDEEEPGSGNILNAMQGPAEAAVALLNDVITNVAIAHGLPVISLKHLICGPEDYANSIEPSSVGGAKIADAIAKVLQTHNWDTGICSIYK
eukprot:TRINITY_DN5296_c0_g1_i2.p1 TRINITY_DN5296_c0_g1~~TRINITY_DN5296_c0_g1_i2.p1  ORF type:complete len:187 (-),score=45.10 TRINITY_DN5296_c0_g1_i2:133-693(-)